MFKNLFLISCLVFATLLGGVANASHSGLTLEGPPAITCDHMGTYTKYLYKNGTSTWSHPIANVARATSAGVVDGLGWATINIDGSVNRRKGSSTLSYRIGKWGTDYTWIWERSNHTPARKVITSYITGPTSTAVGPYNWDATGYVEVIPKYYEGSLNGAWATAPKSKIGGSGTGDWKVATKVECASPNSCNKGRWVDTANEHQVLCDACNRTYYNCHAGSVTYHTGTGTCPGCGETHRHCMGYYNGRSKHTILICEDCLRNDRDGAGYHKCQGHSCFPTDSNGNTNSNTNSTNGGGTVGGSGGSDSYVACPAGSSCSRGGRVSAPSAHKRRSNSGCGHEFYECIDGEGPKHRLRTCSRCNTRYTQCGNWGPCRHNGRTYVYHN